MIRTGHAISHWLPCPVPSWVLNTFGTWGGNSVKIKLNSLVPKTSAKLHRPTKKENEFLHPMVNTGPYPKLINSVIPTIIPNMAK